MQSNSSRLASCFLILFGLSAAARAETLPGFRTDVVAQTTGFLSSLVVDSSGTIYYTTTAGAIVRLSGGTSTTVAQIATEALGNAGLLGMALENDRFAVVHYTTARQTHEVVSRIDLLTGAETVIARLPCDALNPGDGVGGEHHGGNPIVAPDGSIYVGIGDFDGLGIAANPQWIAGKILRISRDGAKVEQVASGFRNPFDLAFDASTGRLVVPDNGQHVDDEINVVTPAGGFFGWPYTAGVRLPYPGAVPPLYTFSSIIAPTGIVRLSGAGPLFFRGYLIGGFASRALYYVGDLDARPFPDPIPITKGDLPPIVDVAEGPRGEIYIGTGKTIYRLVMPRRGDCNCDGQIDLDDLSLLDRELTDGDPQSAVAVQNGFVRSSWACDVNGDGVISAADREVMWLLATQRVMGVRRR